MAIGILIYDLKKMKYRDKKQGKEINIMPQRPDSFSESSPLATKVIPAV